MDESKRKRLAVARVHGALHVPGGTSGVVEEHGAERLRGIRRILFRLRNVRQVERTDAGPELPNRLEVAGGRLGALRSSVDGEPHGIAHDVIDPGLLDE